MLHSELAAAVVLGGIQPKGAHSAKKHLAARGAAYGLGSLYLSGAVAGFVDQAQRACTSVLLREVFQLPPFRSPPLWKYRTHAE